MGRLRFEEQKRSALRGNRNLVISKAFDEEGHFRGYSVSECIVTEQDGKKEDMFLKGSGLGIVSKKDLAEIVECLKSVLEE